MEYRYKDSGEGDLRVRRSRTGFKETYLEMLNEMEPDSITVSTLAERAGINRKTFYLHYKNFSVLRNEIADDMARTLEKQFNGDLEHDILTLYEFLDAQDDGAKLLFTEPEFREFRIRFEDDVFTKGAFGEWVSKAADPPMIEGYFTSVIGIYTRYSGKNLKRLARKVTNLVMCGISGGE